MGTEIVKSETYLPATASSSMADLVAENLGGMEDVNAFDLEAIKIPTAGGIQWQMPDGSTAKTVRGVIVAWSNCRAYWADEFSGAEPPSCSSGDGVSGIGDPGGKCSLCPFAQFGSAAKGAGQACKAMRRLLIQVHGHALPQMMTLPPTSLKACRKYFVHLVSSNRPFYAVETEFGLEAAQSADGIKYAVATFTDVRPLGEDELAQVQALAAQLKPLLRHAPIESNGRGVEL